MNEILLRRKNKVMVSFGNEKEPNMQYIATILKNVESLGYTLSSSLIDVLKTLNKEELNHFYLELIPVLKELVGDNVSYHPMYPNFPKSVMNADEVELYVNAVIHYLSGGTLYPVEEKEERLPLLENTNLQIIDLGSKKDLQDIFENLCTSKTSLSVSDKEDLVSIFKNMNIRFPEEVPLKENAALISKLYIENSKSVNANQLSSWMKTATDVLRFITVLSDGDISLATNTKFRNFNRSERRLIMDLLNNCSSIEEDMNRYKYRWIRIGEKIHPGTFNKDEYKKVLTAFDKLRNNKKIETFSGKVEESIKEKNYTSALSLLKKRPGELARKLDQLLRNAENKNEVVNTFKEVATQISTPVLLQVKAHFEHRNNDENVRVFFPKGELARSYNIKNDLENIENKYCKAIVNICDNALIENYKKKDFLGNIYLSEEFKNYIVPFSQRSASKATKPMTRGSRFKINENAKTLRSFIWWTNTDKKVYDDYEDDSRVDIDLSAAIFDENWNYMEHVSYTNLRSDKYQACHSGDITNGGPINGNGVSEFIDIDIDSVLNYGARYVVFQVYSYTEQKYCNLPHAMFGWMEREENGSGEIYEPKTVKQKMDLTANSVVAIPVIFDCLERELIWCDMSVALNNVHKGGNNVESNLSTVAATCYGMVNMHKPSMYDLINLHARARGVLVENKEDADIIFDIEKDSLENMAEIPTHTITPFDLDEIMGKYL